MHGQHSYWIFDDEIEILQRMLYTYIYQLLTVLPAAVTGKDKAQSRHSCHDCAKHIT